MVFLKKGEISCFLRVIIRQQTIKGIIKLITDEIDHGKKYKNPNLSNGLDKARWVGGC
jgi:hypothetical protein